MRYKNFIYHIVICYKTVITFHYIINDKLPTGP